jgi:hypothetical protein
MEVLVLYLGIRNSYEPETLKHNMVRLDRHVYYLIIPLFVLYICVNFTKNQKTFLKWESTTLQIRRKHNALDTCY